MTLLQALRRRTGGLHALLVALLLLQAGAQWRALQHAVAHGGEPAAAAAVLAVADQGSDWGHAAGDAECRLIDALFALAPGGDDPATPAAPLPAAAPVATTGCGAAGPRVTLLRRARAACRRGRRRLTR